MGKILQFFKLSVLFQDAEGGEGGEMSGNITPGGSQGNEKAVLARVWGDFDTK